MTRIWFAIFSLTTLLAFSEHAFGDGGTAKPCPVKTLKDKCCVFPFRYRGKVYNSCTFVKSSYKWCSLTSDYDKDKQWGYCKENCKQRTTKGQCCVFPFKYDGKTFYTCTFYKFKKKWCSLTYNYEKRWGYCDIKGWK